jgi:S-disulfanyl-L-cysteine oxidoreductase SoxD
MIFQLIKGGTMKKVQGLTILFLTVVVFFGLQGLDARAVEDSTGKNQSVSSSGDSQAKVNLPEADPALGETTYKKACFVCHDSGLMGAPKLGSAEAWRPKIDKGMETLFLNVVNGYQGTAGYMPPRGGNMDLSDQEVFSALVYMIEKSR